MLRKAIFAIALVALASTSALATTNIVGGDHVVGMNGSFVLPIMGTTDAADTTSGIVLQLTLPGNGPIVTNVNLITGTVWEPNNIGQQDYGVGFPEYLVPTRTPAYFTGTVSGSVPLGIVGFITIDTTGVAPGVYDLIMEDATLGPSFLYDAVGTPGIATNGTITVVPEPASVVMGLFAAAGLGAVVIRRRRARNA